MHAIKPCLVWALPAPYDRRYLATEKAALTALVHRGLIQTGKFGDNGVERAELAGVKDTLPRHLHRAISAAKRLDLAALNVWALFKCRGEVARVVDGDTLAAIDETLGHYVRSTALKPSYMLDRDVWPGACEWWIYAPHADRPATFPKMVPAVEAILRRRMAAHLGLRRDQFQLGVYDPFAHPATVQETLYGTFLVRPPGVPLPGFAALGA